MNLSPCLPTAATRAPDQEQNSPSDGKDQLLLGFGPMWKQGDDHGQITTDLPAEQEDSIDTHKNTG